ncbi:MAG: hypothetical protein COB67_05045 [SAR324 cluster bacterium]|uniref:CheW-like domain-containing protein n=1 Tax=SAR324 cluster bacterium TaxID=2024889 RepID=A0A2A4T6N3_9DELT|nr:MAG: hypothetical protein COB67_05045 [SAR324 cluster bacterium]
MQDSNQSQAIVKSDFSNYDHQFVSFWISNELFGVDILDVKEVTPMIKITPVFHAPDGVKGYVNIRGEIHLVLDLRFHLGFPEKETDQNSRIVIFKPTIAEPFGILVDHIGDVIEVKSDQIESETQLESSGSKSRSAHLVSGICKLEKELLITLNPKKFLQ